jgi:hypothetical protein
MSESIEATRTRRRWFRFSLRTMLAIIVVIAIPIAWIAKERRQSTYEQQIAEQLREQGFKTIWLGGPYDSWNALKKSQGLWRNLAGQVLGERIVCIANPPPKFGDLVPLAGLTNVQFLELRALGLEASQVHDIMPLSGLTDLQRLSLSGTYVADLTPLASLVKLEELNLTDTLVGDLTPLYGLTRLRKLQVSKTLVTEDQVEALQKALPKCKIDHDPFP